MNTNTKPLPPDPEGENDERANKAEQAYWQFMVSSRVEPPFDGPVAREDCPLSDLLANLMHWCDRNDCDFAEELRKARVDYGVETMSSPATDKAIRVIAIVRGGIVVGAVSNSTDVDFSVLDHDDLEASQCPEDQRTALAAREVEAQSLIAIY